MNIILAVKEFLSEVGKARLTLSSIEFIKSLTSKNNGSVASVEKYKNL